MLEKCKKDVKVIVLGNKTDLKREVQSEEGSNFASDNGFLFMETSCAKNENVADAFTSLIELTNRESKKNNDAFNLGETEVEESRCIRC